MYQLYKKQFVSASIEDVWNFISSPDNLKKITPEYMSFKVKSKHLPEKMYEGMMVHYEVKPLLGIPMLWVTEITKVKEGAYFVDEQRVGPYKLWHHEHFVKEVEGGVEMTDIVSYMPPFGIIGRMMNWFIIRSQLEGIFKYREKAINEIF